MGRRPATRRPRPDIPADARPSSSSWAPTCSPRVRPAACSSRAAISRQSRSGTAASSALPSTSSRSAPTSTPPTPSTAAHGGGDGRGSRRCRCSARWPRWPPSRHPLPEPGDRLCRGARVSWVPFRLVRVSRPPAPAADALSITELLKATRQARSPWVGDVRGVYDGAARYNALLCSSLLRFFGDAPPRRHAGP